MIILGLEEEDVDLWKVAWEEMPELVQMLARPRLRPSLATPLCHVNTNCKEDVRSKCRRVNSMRESTLDSMVPSQLRLWLSWLKTVVLYKYNNRKKKKRASRVSQRQI